MRESGRCEARHTHRRAVLVAGFLLLGSALPANAQRGSQRPLPLPPSAVGESGAHLELLRRLRETLSQAPPATEPLPADPAQVESGSEVTEQSPGDGPATPDLPARVPSDQLLELGRSLQQLAPNLPPQLVPEDLLKRLPQELLQSFEHPETQQRLKELIQQFRNDGLMRSETGGAGTETVPPIDSAEIPRNSLRKLDEFLQEFRRNLPTEDASPEMQPKIAPRPLRRRDAPAAPGEGRPRLLPPLRSQQQTRPESATTPPMLRNSSPPALPPQLPQAERPGSQTTPPRPESGLRFGRPRGLSDSSATQSQEGEESRDTDADLSGPPVTESSAGPAGASPGVADGKPENRKPSPAEKENSGGRYQALQELFQRFSRSAEKPDKQSFVPEFEEAPSQRPRSDKGELSGSSELSREALRGSEKSGNQDGEEDTATADGGISVEDYLRERLEDPEFQKLLKQRRERNARQNAAADTGPQPASPSAEDSRLAEETRNQLRRNGIGPTLRNLLDQAGRNAARRPAEDPAPNAPFELADNQQEQADPSAATPGMLDKLRDSVQSLVEKIRPEIERGEESRSAMADRWRNLQERLQSSQEDMNRNSQNASDRDRRSLELAADVGSDSETAAESFDAVSTAVKLSITLLLLIALAASLIPLTRWFLRRKETTQERLLRQLAAPGEILKPADVIPAFHHLAMSTAGNARPWWNHQQMSRALERRFPEQRGFVQSLSRFYERARYRPVTAEIEDAELQQARSDLDRLEVARTTG